MAELDRPEPWSHLLNILPGANANRVDRALRSLKNVHLIEMRTQASGDPLVGLHPIIREFVRTSFPKREREQYVGKILDFLDRMIGRFRGILSQDPSYDVLEHWMRKAEYQITFGHFDRATDTIAEISRPLANRGYAEDMIRLTLRLLSECDWTEACTSYRQFDGVFARCLTHMIQMGHDEVPGCWRNTNTPSLIGAHSSFCFAICGAIIIGMQENITKLLDGGRTVRDFAIEPRLIPPFRQGII